MRPVIATFARTEQADAFALSLERRIGVPASVGTLGAWGEPLDGHRLVVAWVDEGREAEARDLVARTGGVLHAGPVTAQPES